MGQITNAFTNVNPRVDFAAVKAASQRSIESLVMRWLPGGKREGAEYKVLNPTRGDKKRGSFSINLRTGKWSDFATGDRGGDMIDLLVYLQGCQPLDAAREIGDLLGVAETSGAEIRTFPNDRRSTAVLSPQDVLRDPALLPPRTIPDADNAPRFVVAGDAGPPVRGDEERRHVYCAGSTPIRIKIIRRNRDNRAFNWYRVADGEVTGWQSRKPVGFKEVPFIGTLDPFATDHLEQQVAWSEGEKDAENLGLKGFFAFTFGGTGDGLPHGCEEYVRGRHVVIFADNDVAGIEHANKKAALAALVAASVRIVQFSDMHPKADVSDWLQVKGNTADRLMAVIAETPLYQPKIEAEPAQQKLALATPIKATPYSWIEPTAIPKRDFVYGRHLIRKFVSATVAPGGVGKSSLIVTEVLAMVSGVDLLGVQPHGRSRVWLWNLEDPREEIARHIQATAKHFNLCAQDIDGHLWVDSGRDQRLVTATTTKEGVMILQPVIDDLVAEIIARGIDVLIIDPFVSSHEVQENDNGAQDAIVKAWGKVAQLGNCAIELVHHARKSSAGETEITVESSRGGKALTDGCRSVRVLNRMSESEGTEAGVENPRLFFRTYVDKGNLAPPADKSDWFKLESVDLGNGVNGGYGDNIGVVTPWQWPDLMADISVKDLLAVQTIISRGQYRASSQAADWVGKAVAEGCRLDLNKPTEKKKAQHLLKVWMASGALKQETRKDDRGNDRPFVVVGDWAT